MCAKPAFTRLVAIALLNYADDEGYFNANAMLMAAQLFPLEDDAQSKLTEAMQLLVRDDFVRLAKGFDGRRYGWIVHFREHQVINRSTPSRIKGLADFGASSCNGPGMAHEDSSRERSKELGKEKGMEQGNEVGGELAPPEETELPGFAPLSEEGKTAFVFATVGREKVWSVSEKLHERLKQSFPDVDIDAELRKAVAKIDTGAVKKKTAGGMTRFLWSWMERTQNGLKGRNGSQRGSGKYSDAF